MVTHSKTKQHLVLLKCVNGLMFQISYSGNYNYSLTTAIFYYRYMVQNKTSPSKDTNWC